MSMGVISALVLDAGEAIKLRALSAKGDRDTAHGIEERSLHAGRVIGLSEAISILQQTAEGLGVALSELRLDDIDPDRDLL